VTPRDRLQAIWREAVRAVHAGDAAGRVLADVAPREPLVVLALGKAAHAMAARVEALAGHRIAGGLAITKDGHGGPLARIPLREAGHPLPDARSEAGAREALRIAAAARPDHVLLVLLSGGASALTACPAPGLELADLVRTTEALLRCGADIAETNAVRKHLSDFSGGRLARASACHRTEVLVVSDVPGDALDVIGSGPCAPDPTTYRDALGALERRAATSRVPARVLAHLRRGVAGGVPETPKAGDPAFARVRHTLIASNADARQAAAEAARSLGLEPVDLGEVLAGEARECARALIAAARARRAPRPRCLIAGGETTVTVRGSGRGGRSQELALSAACELAEGSPFASVLAAGTDGTDGPTDAAGAFADAGSVQRGRAAGADARRALAGNDAYGFFEREGGLFVTGPTGTNVMDLVLIEVS
jgi:glycerate-2-kinase